tara:strand:- start:2436 stop:3218 length:783 start_codon:yes stop_codon:yes gene_type:complete
MIKNISQHIILLFLSFFLVFILSDKVILPYVFYVEETIVPNVVNHDLSTAKIILDENNLEFKIQYIPSNNDDVVGLVINSVPSQNKKVKRGTIIDLKVFGQKETYLVPELILKSKNIGVNILKSMGIKIDTIFYDYWDVLCTSPLDKINQNINQIFDDCLKHKKNIIWDQFPRPNEKVLKGKPITLYVSKGRYAPEFYDVPILIELDLKTAIEKINKAGLLLGDIEYVNSDLNIQSNIVIDQIPYGKCRISDKINLTIKK